MGSKYLTKNIILDQDFQAKKIGLAASGKAAEIQLTPDQGRPVLPTGMNAIAQLDEAPQAETVSATQPTTRWTDQIVPAAARPPVTELARTEQTWAERSAAAPEAPQALRA